MEKVGSGIWSWATGGPGYQENTSKLSQSNRLGTPRRTSEAPPKPSLVAAQKQSRISQHTAIVEMNDSDSDGDVQEHEAAVPYPYPTPTDAQQQQQQQSQYYQQQQEQPYSPQQPLANYGNGGGGGASGFARTSSAPPAGFGIGVGQSPMTPTSPASSVSLSNVSSSLHSGTSTMRPGTTATQQQQGMGQGRPPTTPRFHDPQPPQQQGPATSQQQAGQGQLIVRNKSLKSFYNYSQNAGSSGGNGVSTSPVAVPALHLGVGVSGGSGGTNPSSARSGWSSFQGSVAGSSVRTGRNVCKNVLVIGPRQVGKSKLVNAYRAVNTFSDKWPAAPVGLCGRHGTTSVDPCPNNPHRPSWLLIDTPGKVYSELHARKQASHRNRATTPQRPNATTNADAPDLSPMSDKNDTGEGGEGSPSTSLSHHEAMSEYDGDDAVLLSSLFDGLPWKTRLVGPGSLSTAAIGEIPCTASNAPHQCVVVLSAKDLLQTSGLRWWPKYSPTVTLKEMLHHLSDLLDYLRCLLQDRPPFVVVTHMDHFLWKNTAEGIITESLAKCVPANRLFFVEMADAVDGKEDHQHRSGGNGNANRGAIKGSASLPIPGPAIDVTEYTKKQLLKLHQDILSDVNWMYGFH